MEPCFFNPPPKNTATTCYKLALVINIHCNWHGLEQVVESHRNQGLKTILTVQCVKSLKKAVFKVVRLTACFVLRALSSTGLP